MSFRPPSQQICAVAPAADSPGLPIQGIGVSLALHHIQLEGIVRTLPRILFLCLGFILSASAASAEGAYPQPPGGADRAPIGVVTSDTLDGGEWMLSYRYARTHRQGNRDGTRRLSLGEVLADFEVAPREMQVQEHVVTAMYAPHDRVTVMAVLPFLVLDMQNVSRAGGVPRSFATHASGIGDIEVHGLVRFMKKERQKLNVALGLSIPSGSISVEDEVGGVKAELPYPMQLGTGTVALLAGSTYLGYHERLSWGCEWDTALQLGRNHKDYRWGSRWHATSWLAYSWGDWASTSLRFSFDRWNNVEGYDTALSGRPSSPTADPGRQAGTRLDLGPGLNFKLPILGDPRLAIEMLWPVYQSLDGPQLETDWTLILGLQLGF